MAERIYPAADVPERTTEYVYDDAGQLGVSSGNQYILQWSHVLTNVETLVQSSRLADTAMLQWSHVLTNVETRSPAPM